MVEARKIAQLYCLRHSGNRVRRPEVFDVRGMTLRLEARLLREPPKEVIERGERPGLGRRDHRLATARAHLRREPVPERDSLLAAKRLKLAPARVLFERGDSFERGVDGGGALAWAAFRWRA